MRVLKTLMASLFFLAAVPLSAQNAINPYLFPRFTITAGGYGGNFSTDVHLNPHGSSSGGSDIDFERDLNADKEKQLGRFTMAWRVFGRHEIALNFFRSTRSSEHVINRELHFGDVVYPVNATVNGNFNINFWDFSYTYWLTQSDSNGLGLNGGVAWMSISTGLSAVGSNMQVSTNQRASTELPIPVFGVQGRHAFTQKLLVTGRLSVLPKIDLSSYSAQAAVAYGALEYRFFNTFALGAGYNYLNVKGSIDKDRFNGDLDYTVQGPEVFVRVVF